MSPPFAEKLTEIVALYVDLPAHAVVLSVDERSQIQALDRSQPGLPIKKGRAGTMTHDYKRHGTTTLFAALNVLDGTVIGQNMQRHRHQEFICFSAAWSARPRRTWISKSSSTTTRRTGRTRCAPGSPAIRAGPLHADFLLLVNAVEGFFAKLTRRRLRHGVFHSAVEPQAAINRLVREYNTENLQPFT